MNAAAKNPSHDHLKAGWVYDEFVGDKGGWRLSGDGVDRIVCKVEGEKGWQAFLIRHEDGSQRHHSRHATRDEAMKAINLRAI